MPDIAPCLAAVNNTADRRLQHVQFAGRCFLHTDAEPLGRNGAGLSCVVVVRIQCEECFDDLVGLCVQRLLLIRIQFERVGLNRLEVRLDVGIVGNGELTCVVFFVHKCSLRRK